jgi:alpha-tubulin suppressor-like RCC1 family protein
MLGRFGAVAVGLSALALAASAAVAGCGSSDEKRAVPGDAGGAGGDVAAGSGAGPASSSEAGLENGGGGGQQSEAGGADTGGDSSSSGAGAGTSAGAGGNEPDVHVVGRGAIALATAYKHICVLLESGAVRCWGNGDFGELGYGTSSKIQIGDDETPDSAGDVEVGGKVKQIVTGGTHTCALLLNGAVRCWGNFTGALGYGNLDRIGDDETPATAGDVDVGGVVTQLAAGTAHTCALLAGGRVRCWGDNRYGQLGYGNTDTIGDDETPASAGDVDVGGKVTQLSAGESHTCALLEGGSVRCWGMAIFGRLGYGNLAPIGDDETPASAGDVVVGGKVTQVVAGDVHTCALLEGGAVRCWGNGYVIGYNNGLKDIGDDETPASAGDVEVGSSVSQISAGAREVCALLSGGGVRCWGRGQFGELGYGNQNDVGDDETPASAGDVAIGGPVAQIAAGYFVTCALLENTAVRCWGNGVYGLGYSNTNTIGDDHTPDSAGDVPY